MKPKAKGRPVLATTLAAKPDYTAINAALEQHLDLAWTEANQRAIKSEVGPGNYRAIQEIISFTSNQDAWINDYSVSSAADKVSGKLSQQYPMLSPSAIFRIINQATYGWR